ncbi:MAG TPA: phosphotransferase [Acidimicrobiia bacterium]|nr:phosphotransferase [Acidimicrobiia bacterium]
MSDVFAAPRQGAWSRAFFFRRGDAHLVIRFAPWRVNFDKDRALARHATTDLPIPPVLEIGEGLGQHYAISERAFGTILEELDPGATERTLPALFRALDGIRVADVSDSTGAGVWSTDGRASHRTWHDYLTSPPPDPFSDTGDIWRSNTAASRPAALPEFDAAHAELRGLVEPCPEVRHLVHSDLLYGNVLAAHGRITAVFDWGCALVGDFLYDLAWLTFWAPWYPGLAAVDLRAAARQHYDVIGLDVPALDARVRCYEVRIGLSGQAYQAFVGEWDEFDATARRVREILA